MNKPTTKAGRRLLEGDFIEADYDGCNIDTRALMAGILAIEREAAARAAERCDRIVNNGFGEPTECGLTLPCRWHDVARAAGIDALDQVLLEAAHYDVLQGPKTHANLRMVVDAARDAYARRHAARAAGIDAALRVEYNTGRTHGWEEGHRAAGIDVEDIRSLANQHESECTYYDGGDFTCSCGYDEALERVSAWLDEQDRLAAEKEK